MLRKLHVKARILKLKNIYTDIVFLYSDLSYLMLRNLNK